MNDGQEVQKRTDTKNIFNNGGIYQKGKCVLTSAELKKWGKDYREECIE